jgi:hypothetical protein
MLLGQEIDIPLPPRGWQLAFAGAAVLLVAVVVAGFMRWLTRPPRE